MNEQIRDNMNVLKVSIADNGHLRYLVTNPEPPEDVDNPTYSLVIDSQVDVALISAANTNIMAFLPNPATFNKQIAIKRMDGTGHTLTLVTGSTSITIDGETSYVLDTQYRSVTLQSDGANWWIL
jgi:hypothetical protein